MSDGITDAMRACSSKSSDSKVVKLVKKDSESLESYSKAYYEGFESGKEAREYQLKGKYEDAIDELKNKLSGEAKDVFDAAYKLGKKEGEAASDAKYRAKMCKMKKALESIKDLTRL